MNPKDVLKQTVDRCIAEGSPVIVEQPAPHVALARGALLAGASVMSSSDRVIPLTPPGPLWSQREYVACVKLGIGFAAHHYGIRQAFHYGFPEGIGCTTVIVSTNSIDRYIDHDFTRGIGWIDHCRRALAREMP